jgi:hypothetical protein
MCNMPHCGSHRRNRQQAKVGKCKPCNTYVYVNKLAQPHVHVTVLNSTCGEHHAGCWYMKQMQTYVAMPNCLIMFSV